MEEYVCADNVTMELKLGFEGFITNNRKTLKGHQRGWGKHTVMFTQVNKIVATHPPVCTVESYVSMFKLLQHHRLVFDVG